MAGAQVLLSCLLHLLNRFNKTKGWCASMQSLFSPVAGVLGDRFNRMHIIVFGTLSWALFTLLFGFSVKYAEVPGALSLVQLCR